MDDELMDLTGRLARVDGVVGVCLGGSRARGTTGPTPTTTSASTAGARSTRPRCAPSPRRCPGRTSTSPTNEKGAADAAAQLPGAPARFADRVRAVFADADLAAAIDATAEPAREARG